MDPLTLTGTEARFSKLLESMLCETIEHRPNCACQDLENIYGRSIYKCSMPGCVSYIVGFDTRAERNQHMQKHTRPFKCQHSKCAFATLGFAEVTDLESHLDKTHSQILHTVPGVTQRWTNASSAEELKAILIDAVQENDLSMIRSEKDAVQKFIFDLLLSAHQVRSSDTMIQHLLGELPGGTFKSLSDDPNYRLRREIMHASVEHGNYEVIPTICGGYEDPSSIWDVKTLHFVGSTRCADVIDKVLSTFVDNSSYLESDLRMLFEKIIPEEPDTKAEILALECLNSLQRHLRRSSKLPGFLLTILSKRCFSIAIAEFLLANGAAIDFANGGLRPLAFAAKQTSREAAEFMEFLVKKGAQTSLMFKGQALSELPGPRNIQRWIGIT